MSKPYERAAHPMDCRCEKCPPWIDEAADVTDADWEQLEKMADLFDEHLAQYPPEERERRVAAALAVEEPTKEAMAAARAIGEYTEQPYPSITFARYIDKAFAEVRAKLHEAEERLRVQAEAVDRQNHTAFEAGKREGRAAVERLQGELTALTTEARVAHNAVAYWAKQVNNATAAKNLGLVVECLRAALASREGTP